MVFATPLEKYSLLCKDKTLGHLLFEHIFTLIIVKMTIFSLRGHFCISGALGENIHAHTLTRSHTHVWNT